MHNWLLHQLRGRRIAHLDQLLVVITDDRLHEVGSDSDFSHDGPGLSIIDRIALVMAMGMIRDECQGSVTDVFRLVFPPAIYPKI